MTIDLNEIRARETAATPGPWAWRGNPDSGHARLVGHRRDVMGLVPVTRTADDPGAKAFRVYLAEQDVADGAGGWRALTDDEIEDRVREEYLTDSWGGEPPAPSATSGFYAVDREIAVYAVCPDAVSRDDPRVYRADITGLRNPDAEFIAHARQDLRDLIDVLDERDADIEYRRRSVEQLAATVEQLTGQLHRAQTALDRHVAASDALTVHIPPYYEPGGGGREPVIAAWAADIASDDRDRQDRARARGIYGPDHIGRAAR